MQALNARPAAGNALLIRIDERFDIPLSRLIHRAMHVLGSNLIEKVVIDLRGRKHLHDSGMALLLLLHDRAGHMGDRLHVVGCRPEIRERLNGLSIGTQLHIA